MKFLVCISKVPDTTSKIAFTDNKSNFDENGVQYIINPYDEWYALVRALELKEANGGNVTVINVGPASNDPTIRKALAIGADAAVRIDADASDALSVAKEIAKHAQEENFDLVLCGKETIDYNGAQLGGMIAGILDQEYISNASSLELDGSKATLGRDIQGGKEILSLNTPFVLSAAKGMAEARIPNMRGIMAARTKPLNVIAASENGAATEVINYELPPAKGDCKYVDAENPAELLNLLRNEAKII